MLMPGGGGGGGGWAQLELTDALIASLTDVQLAEHSKEENF